MRPNSLLLSLALCAVGCGGGGSSPTPLPTNAVAFVTPTPKATVAASITHPIVANEFYVAGGGTDSGTCQSIACATITYTTQQALEANANGQVVYVNLGPGGWNESVNVTGSVLGSANTGHNDQLIFNGSGSGETTWNGSTGSCGVLIANAGANIGVQNLTMEAEGNPCQSILYAQLGGLIQVYGGLVFGPAYQQQMHAEGTGSQIEVWNSYTISGGAGAHIGAISGALVELNPTAITVTILGNPNFPGAFVQAQADAVVYLGAGTTFSGSITGPAYSVSSNATIFTDGAGCATIPGSPGNVSTGGVCT